MIGEQHGALGEMVNTSWRRGRRTGFVEGLIVGFLTAILILFVRFCL